MISIVKRCRLLGFGVARLPRLGGWMGAATGAHQVIARYVQGRGVCVCGGGGDDWGRRVVAGRWAAQDVVKRPLKTFKSDLVSCTQAAI